MTVRTSSEAPRRVFRSVPPAVSSFAACIDLLARVEQIPYDVTGALAFDDGLVLVERQQVCWAISSSMGLYLTDLLCESESRNVSRREIEEVYRRCKRSGLRLSEELLASGLIGEDRLRQVLREHNSEAIVRLSRSTAAPRFRRLSRSRHADRFLLTPVELLAAIGARGGESRASQAALEFEHTLVDGAAGVAFAQDSPRDAPTIVAVNSHCALPVREVQSLCRWASEFLNLGILIDPATVLASATRGANTAVIAWRAGDLCYAALCSTRFASAVLTDRVAKRHARSANAEQVAGGWP